MGFISRLFRKRLTEEEMAGITMDKRDYWEVLGIKAKQAGEFFLALIELMPADSTFCVEGTSLARKVKSFFKKSRTPHTTRVWLGTSYPRPDVFHIAFNEQNMRQIADFTGIFSVPEICDHIYIYRDDNMLLEWTDAFSKSLYISKIIPEKYVKVFCEKFGCIYRDASSPYRPADD